jgi:hypothetical protein
MEEQDDVLAAVKAVATRVEEGFARVEERFVRADAQFAQLRGEFATQLDGLSEGFHTELKAEMAKVRGDLGAWKSAFEKIEGRVALVGENVGNVVKQLTRYNTEIEAPLEKRVTDIEARVWVLEQKK